MLIVLKKFYNKLPNNNGMFFSVNEQSTVLMKGQ